MASHRIEWIIELFGDGKGATRVVLPIATSPVFAPFPALDSPRNQRPSSAEIVEVSAGPDSYCPPHGTKTVTHRPMIDSTEKRTLAVVNGKGEPVMGEDGKQKTVEIDYPVRVEGPEVTETIPIREGDAPQLPTIVPSVSSDGVLTLDLSEPIRAGESIGVVGAFIYELGA